MKKFIITILALAFLLIPTTAQAAPNKDLTATVTQLTDNIGSQEKPVANSKTLFYSQCVSNTECDIYQKDLKTGAEKLLIAKSGDQFPVAATNRFVVYNSYNYSDPSNKYEAYYYDLKNNQDVLFATGLENDIVQDAYGSSIIFTIGDQIPDLYLYDIHKATTTLIAEDTIRPKIWRNKIVWIESAGGGLANSVIYDLKTGIREYVADNVDGYNSWPEIWKNYVVWQGLYDHQGIFYKNLKTGEQVKIAETGDSPMIYDNFITWTDYTSNPLGELWAYDLKTGQSLKITENIKHNHAQYMLDNSVFWTDILDNNIYKAELSRS